MNNETIESKEKIILEFDKYLKSQGAYNNKQHFYVGITGIIENRLFGYHKVDKDNEQNYIYAKASSVDIARDIEKMFIDCGFDGGDGGGNDEETNHVYIYKKVPGTRR